MRSQSESPSRQDDTFQLKPMAKSSRLGAMVNASLLAVAAAKAKIF